MVSDVAPKPELRASPWGEGPRCGLCVAMAAAWLVGAGLALAAGGCGKERSQALQEASSVPTKPIEQVLQEKTESWTAMPGVVGTGIGESRGRPCIVVFTSQDPAGLRSKIPPAVDGHPVVLRRAGDIQALDAAQ